MDSKVVIPPPIFGKKDTLVFDALAPFKLPSYILDTTEALNYELIRKNLYILITNIAGLEVYGNIESLNKDHNEIIQAVSNDVLDIQDWLTETTNEHSRLIEGIMEAFNGDPQHCYMGPSAPVHLTRALGFADQAGLPTSKLEEISSKYLQRTQWGGCPPPAQFFLKKTNHEAVKTI